MSHPKAGPVLAKKYVPVRFDLRGPAGVQLASKYKVDVKSIVLMTGDGDVVATLPHAPAADRVADALVGVPEFRAGKDELEKLKEKGITKTNAPSVASALKKVGQIDTKEAREMIAEYVKDEAMPEAVRRGAILALGKQSEAGEEVVPFLTSKNSTLKMAAQVAIKDMGMKAMPALLKGLESDEADVRIACHAPAAAVTKSGKVARDSTFWKIKKPDERAKALEDWKAWYADKVKPAPAK